MIKDMDKILEKLNNFEDLSEANIIERAKAVLKEEDPNEYKEWKKDKFNPDHLFKLGDNLVGTLLHLACWCNDERIVKLLIDTRVIDVKKQGGYWEMSPLMVAADESSQSIVKRLLKAGADPSATNDWEDSVIYQREENSRTRPHADLIIQFTLLLNPQEEEIDGLDLADKIQYWDDCKDAAKKMQSDDPLLREFLLELDETKLAGYLNNPDMREKLKTGQYKKKYPLYADLIEIQYEKAREKVKERF